MKAKFLVLLLPLIVFASGAVFATGLTLDHVDGLYATDTIPVGQQVTFWIRITNGDTAHGGVANGFRVYSPDGAEWGATVPDTAALNWASMFSLVFAIKSEDVDGVAMDTVGFGGSYNPLTSVGIPANFDSVSYSITIGPIPAQYSGKTIVLDSSWYPPIGRWKWAGPDAFPEWGGPYTFTVFDPALDVTTDPSSGLPTRFALNQNYPNPFNPTTQIKFDLPTRSKVSIDVYNVLGQKVKTLVNDEMAAGSYIADWDGTSDGGKTVSSGVYFYRMQAGKFLETKKMMLLK